LQLQRDVNYFPLVFKKYQIDSTQFKESNFYYTSRIDDYEDILNQVAARLEKIQNEIDEAKVVKDSLENIKNPNKNMDDYE
jgi:hypothetical protein